MAVFWDVRQSTTTLMMKAVSFSELGGNIYESMWGNIPENNHLHTHFIENLRSHLNVCKFGSVLTDAWRLNFLHEPLFLGEDTVTVMEEDLRLCSVKPVLEGDRRFCFEVLSPTK
jgi:hypothetical protein